MCGLFGVISDKAIEKENLEILALHSRQRGEGACGLLYHDNQCYRMQTHEYGVNKLLKAGDWKQSDVVIGYSSVSIKDRPTSQSAYHESVFAFSDGLIVNESEVTAALPEQGFPRSSADVIGSIASNVLQEGVQISELPDRILSVCKGSISAVLVFPNSGKAVLFSNTGSLFVGKTDGITYISSEKYPLQKINCSEVCQIHENGLEISVPIGKSISVETPAVQNQHPNAPSYMRSAGEEKLLKYQQHNLVRCTKCILPETMPFISFDSEGVCNYCRNYKLLNVQKPKEEFFKLLEPYRKSNKPDCIIPFSGGRDSSYGLHLIVNELKMKPITYTYDWGMVTDLGRRNISRMCAELGVENIVVVADINKKRSNIKKNLAAWLKSPHLGMISVLTAGDKHFFQHIDTIKKQTGIQLNLWGTNPMEVTHFKAGFLGIKPHFEEKNVYMKGMRSQFNYHTKRLGAMLQSPGYFNTSLWDTLSGEYYRSFSKKSDYYHVFDYWTWEENTINDVLKDYNWETAPDTNTTWRIGDGTAGLYNYIYYMVAGLTEHDTFRSNQIREGQLTRQRALELVEDENRPRYENIRWYLDILDMDFGDVIRTINNIPTMMPGVEMK